jgi:hypothetical protein
VLDNLSAPDNEPRGEDPMFHSKTHFSLPLVCFLLRLYQQTLTIDSLIASRNFWPREVAINVPIKSRS